MKKKGLKQAIADGTEVAVYVGWRERGDDAPKGARKAKVLAVDQVRRVFSGRRDDMGGHPAEDGVKIAYTDPIAEHQGGSHPVLKLSPRFTGSDTQDQEAAARGERIVAPREVLMTWDAYLDRRTEIEGKTEAKKAEFDRQSRLCSEAVERMGVGRVEAVYTRPLGAAIPQHVGYRVILSPGEADRVSRAKEES